MLKHCLTFCVLCMGAIAAHAEEFTAPIAVSDLEMRRELLRRFKVDQDARIASMNWCNKHGMQDPSDVDHLDVELRAEYEKLLAEFKDVDVDNTKWLKESIENGGWPTVTRVGKDGANAAWILAQHADADPKFQRRCLDLMAKLPKEEVLPENLAYLTDRVLLAEGEKQRYGTQFILVEGRLQSRPLEDEANVDQLRAAVGLPPLAEYLEQAEKTYIGSAK